MKKRYVYFLHLINVCRRRSVCRTCHTSSSSQRLLLGVHVGSLDQSSLRALLRTSSESCRARYRRSKRLLTSLWYKMSTSLRVDQIKCNPSPPLRQQIVTMIVYSLRVMDMTHGRTKTLKRSGHFGMFSRACCRILRLG